MRFCLICNYINRIDESLRDIFVRLRFNQLPQDLMIQFLLNITKHEKIDLSRQQLKHIQQAHQSDMRSMINYIQTNNGSSNIISDEVWDNFKTTTNIRDYIQSIKQIYQLQIIDIVKMYAKYVIRKGGAESDFLDSMEFILHHPKPNHNYIYEYFIHKIEFKKTLTNTVET